MSRKSNRLKRRNEWLQKRTRHLENMLGELSSRNVANCKERDRLRKIVDDIWKTDFSEDYPGNGDLAIRVIVRGREVRQMKPELWDSFARYHADKISREIRNLAEGSRRR